MVGADRWLNTFCFHLIDTDQQDQTPPTEEKKQDITDGESKAASDKTQSKRQPFASVKPEEQPNMQDDRDTNDGRTEKEPGILVDHLPLLVKLVM